MHNLFSRMIIFLSIFTSCISEPSFAADTKLMRDNDAAEVNVSNKNLTRIAVINDRIQSVYGMEGAYQLTKDETLGAIFIKPVFNKKLSLFISTEEGHTFTLLLNPSDIEADSILIQPLTPHKKEVEHEHWANNTPYLESIVQLMKSMVNNDTLVGYSILTFPKNKIYSRHSGFKLERLMLYQGSQFQGEVWKIKNTVCKTRPLDVKRFFTPEVLALSLKDNVIKNCGETLLYRVMRYA